MKRLLQTLALSLSLTVSAQVVKLEGAKVHQYKQAGDAKLFLHVFNPEGHKVSDQHPAIVFFFGGGWNGGTPKQFDPHCIHHQDYLLMQTIQMKDHLLAPIHHQQSTLLVLDQSSLNKLNLESQ